VEKCRPNIAERHVGRIGEIMAVFEDGWFDGEGDMDENERYIRNMYPKIEIKRWWARNMGVYDVSCATEEIQGNLLGIVYRTDGHDDWKRTWKEIRKHIDEEMMYQLEGNTQDKPRLPIIFRRSKKAP